MKTKHSKHLELSNVECAHKDCRKNNGLNGHGPRRLIKQKIVDMAGENHGPLFCYKCGKIMKGASQAAKVKAMGA